MPVDQIVITTPPTPAVAPVTPVVDPSRPAWLPEKFKTAEEFAASYTELETKLGKPAVSPAVVDLSNPAAATTALNEKGVDIKALEAEYLKDGKLSDVSMKGLTDKGFTADQVKSYVAGQQAQADAHVKGIHDSVGGKDSFDKLYEFAKTNLTAAEAAAYNKAASTGDYDTLKLILGGLQSKFTAKFGKEPSLINGGIPNTTSNTYANDQEFFRDQRDPRYAKDPVFQKQVIEKMKASTHLYAKTR